MIVFHHDARQQAYYQRIDLLNLWLSHHQLPLAKRHYIRRFFKELLKQKAKQETNAVMHDITPEIFEELSRAVIHPDLEDNYLFEEFSTSELVQVSYITKQVIAEVDETVVQLESPGLAMFLITEGFARQDFDWILLGGPDVSCVAQQPGELQGGDSFGEEIILGLKVKYEYTIIATTNLEMLMIPLDEFTEHFGKNDKVLQQMLTSYRMCKDANVSLKVSESPKLDPQAIGGINFLTNPLQMSASK